MSAMSDTYPLDIPYSFPPNPHFSQNMYYPSQSLLYPATSTINDMPRPAFFSYSPDVIKHRKRTSRSQRKLLEDAFKQNPKPSQYTRKLLIHQTGMDRRAIQVWFQNRRAKEKKLAAKAQVGSGNAEGDKGDDSRDLEDDAGNASDDHDESGEPAEFSSEQKLKVGDGGQTPTPPATSSVASPLSTPNASPAGTTSGWRSMPSSNPLLVPDVYNMRRESAPALADVQRPPHFAHPSQLAATDTPQVWDGVAQPSPPSADGDLYAMRRGSLPAFGTSHQVDSSPTVHRVNVCRATGLPGVPVDPNVRRMSLERSRMRLSTHPYAPQVAASNRNFNAPFANPLITGIPQKAATAYPSPQTQVDWDGSRSASDAFPSYIRPRRHGSYHSGMYSHVNVTDPGISLNAPLRPHTEIVPGPLPAPNFSFGTASSNAIPETENEGHQDIEEDLGNLSASNPELYVQQRMIPNHRFGSFASIASTETTGSSVTTGSAWFAGSDVPGSSGSGSVEEFSAPTGWANHADVRRASCPVPFIYAFSSLHMNNAGVPAEAQTTPDSIGSATTDGSGLMSGKSESPVEHHGLAKVPEQPFSPVYYGESFNQTGFHVESPGTDTFAYTPSLSHVAFDAIPLTSQDHAQEDSHGIPYTFYQ